MSLLDELDESSVQTRLEFFLIAHELKPVHVAREASISRQHLLRVRKAVMEPTRSKIAQIVSALRRMTFLPVEATQVFELSVDENGSWALAHVRREVASHAKAYRSGMRAATVAIKNTLLAPPAEWKSKFTGGGVSEFLVRQLLLTAHRMLDDKPDRAIQVLAVAEELVKELPTLTNENLLHALRGRTFLDRAVAYRTLGQFPASTAMLDNAEAEYRKTPYCINELAQTWYERAASHFKRGELDAAMRFIEQARNIFVLTADRRRAAKTRMVEACVLVDRGALRDARESFREAITAFRVFEDREALACAYLNLGSTEMRLGHTRTARKALDAALIAFTKQKNEGEVVRARWNLAHLATFYEKSLLGLPKLRDARRDFTELRMTADAAFVGLDIARALLDSGEFEEAEQLCGVIFNEFADSGIPKNALEALGYLRDAASRRNADGRLVDDVRRFVERAPFHPEAVFHPA